MGRAVAPIAESVAREFSSTKPAGRRATKILTHLTQQHRRDAKGSGAPSSALAPRPQKVCRDCGVVLSSNQRNHCALCGVSVSTANMIELARKGRLAAKSAESRTRMSASQKRQRAARRGWLPSSLPSWLNQSSYRELVLPRLAAVTVPVLAQTLTVSEPYAAKARKGQHVPHPMHWQRWHNSSGFRNSHSRGTIQAT